MIALLPALLLCGCPACDDGSVPYLQCQGRYDPQPGDLFFGWSGNPAVKLGFMLVRAGPPSHVGMVVRLPDGELAILEATAREPQYGDRPGVYLRPALFRLRTYQGPVWIRRLREPLTPEQCECLTAFALAQVGKPFSRPKSILIPALSLPCRTALGARLFGPIPLDKRTWFCTELLVTAGVLLGYLDPCKVKPIGTDPQDMIADTFLDLSCHWAKAVRLYWAQPCGMAADGCNR